MRELSGLQKRVRDATGPDRKLDAAIWDFFHPSHIDPTVKLPKDFGKAEPPYDFGRIDPEYTASIDAALLLVEKMLPPDIWGWEIHRDDDHFKGPTFYWAAVRELTMLPVSHGARGATAPLAILDALLSALSSKEP